MIFYFFILTIFIAELIITITVFTHLCKISKLFKKINFIIDDIKPEIKDTASLLNKLSEQCVELSHIITENIQSFFKNLILNQIKNTVSALTFWAVKTEVSKHINN